MLKEQDTLYKSLLVRNRFGSILKEKYLFNLFVKKD